MAITETGLAMVFDPKEFAYLTGHVFRGITLSERSDGWNIIVRGYNKQQHAVYAMMSAEHPVDGILSLVNALSSRGGESLWRIDKYAR